MKNQLGLLKDGSSENIACDEKKEKKKKRKSNGLSDTAEDIKKPKLDIINSTNDAEEPQENPAASHTEDDELDPLSKSEANKLSGKSLRKAFKSPEALDALKKFVSIATSKKGKDLAAEYLAANGNVIEILKLLENSDKKNSNTTTVVFSAMNIIIMKILSQCPQYQSHAEEACRYFINTHLSSVHSLLSSGSTPKQRKIVLRLLTSIVTLGGKLPHELLGHLSFHQQIIDFLAQQTMPTDPESVRTCFIHFILAFLVDGSTPVIRALLEKHGLLSSIFADLMYDSHTTVNLVLNTVKTFVLENKAITKTTKVKVFSTPVTLNLVALYNWKGPKSWSRIKKKEQTVSKDLVNPEEKEIVVDAVHDFLTVLLTSSRYGIVFNAKSLGSSADKSNKLINSVLQNLDRPWEHEKPCDLVVKILSACPDLIKSQLSYTEAFLEPRESIKWLSAMAFIQKIIAAVDQNVFFKSTQSELSVAQLVSVTLTSTMPLVVLKTAVTPSMKSTSIIVRHEALKTIGIMSVRMKEFFQVTENHFQDSADFIQYKSRISDYISRNIPSVDEILETWSKVIDLKNEDYNSELVDRIPTRLEHFSVVLNLVLSLRDVCPDFIKFTANCTVTPQTVMRGLKECEEFECDELNLVKMKAIQIIMALDPSSINTKNTIFRDSLVFLISLLTDDYSQVDREAKATIKMMLEPLEIFKDNEQLDIWLNCFTRLKSVIERLEVAKWFVKVVHRATKRAETFLDLISKAEENSSDLLTVNHLTDATNGCDHEEDTKILQMQSASSIPIVLCSALEYLKESPHENASEYLSYVVILTLHCQIIPEALINLCESLENDATKKYLTSWKEGKSIVKKPFSSKSLVCKFSKMLLSEEKIIFSDIFQGDDEVKIVIRDEEICFKHSLNIFEVSMLLRMTLFYLTQFLRRKQLTQQQFDRFKEIIIILLHITKDLNQKINYEGSAKCLRMIVSNPIIFHYFSPFTQKKHDLENIITKGLIDIFKKIIEIADTKFIVQLFVPCRNKYISELKAIVKNAKNEWKYYNLDSSMDFVTVLQLEKGEIVELLKEIMTLPEKKFLNQGKTSMTTWGLFTPKLFELLSLEDGKTMKEDDINIIQPILHHFWQLKSNSKLHLDHWEVAICNYLKKYPHNVAKIDRKKFAILLNQELKPSTIKLISFLINRNEKLILGFVDFVTTKPEYFQRSDVILPILSSNLSFKWNEKFIKTIFKHHKNDIVNYFSFSTEKKECFDDNQETICYLINNCMKLKTSEAIIDTILSSGDKLDAVDLHYIKLLRCLFQRNAKLQENPTQMSKNWVQVLVRLMVCALKKPSKADDKLKIVTDYICETLDALTSSQVDFTFEEITKNPSWPQFSRFTLKNGLKAPSEDSASQPELLKTFAKLCQVAYADKCEDEHVKTLFEMTTSHSEFVNLILSNYNMKKYLLQLLWVLVNKNLTVMASSHIPLYLSAYTGTMSESDQRIMMILQHYETQGIKLNDYEPYLWGETAINHYSIRGETDNALWRQPGTSQVLDLFNEDTVRNTIRNYPVHRDLKTTADCLMTADSDIYDPAFYLPLLNSLLESNKVVPCHKVTQTGALALIIAACGSACQDVRLAAFTGIARFHFHLEATNRKEKLLWIRFIEILKNGITSFEGQLEDLRLSCLITTFLAEASLILTQPLNKLFEPLANFLIAKPALDLQSIPEFLKLFHSSEINHQCHRHWILQVIRDGMKTDVDVKLAMRCVIFKMLWTFYNSILADPVTKNLILEIVNKTIAIPKATILCRLYSLLPWLVMVTRQFHENDIQSIDLINNIVRTLLDGALKRKECEGKFFLLLMILKNLRIHLTKNINLQTLHVYLSSLNDVLSDKSSSKFVEKDELIGLLELTKKISGNSLEECEEILRHGSEFVDKNSSDARQVNKNVTTQLLKSILIKSHSHTIHK